MAVEKLVAVKDDPRWDLIVLDTPRAGHGPGRTWTAARLEVTAPAPVRAR